MSFLEYIENRELDAFTYKVYLLAEGLNRNKITFKQFWEERGLRIMLEGNYATEDQLMDQLTEGLWDKAKSFLGQGTNWATNKKQGDPALATTGQTTGDEYSVAPMQGDTSVGNAMGAGVKSQTPQGQNAPMDPTQAMGSAPAAEPVQTGQSPAQAMGTAAAGVQPELVKKVYDSVTATAPALKQSISAAIQSQQKQAVQDKDQVSFAVLKGLNSKLGSVIDAIAKNPQKWFPNITKGGNTFQKASQAAAAPSGSGAAQTGSQPTQNLTGLAGMQ